MKQTAILTTTSLLSILFMTFHLTDDILFKMARPGLVNLFAVLIFVVWLYGTLALAERRAGYIIIFLGSLLGLVVPVVHMKGAGGVVGGEIGKSSEAFFFVWTLLALGVTAMFSVVLSARALPATVVCPPAGGPHEAHVDDDRRKRFRQLQLLRVATWPYGSRFEAHGIAYGC